MRKKVQVWIYARSEEGNAEFLVLKLTPKRGGFWQPVTGGVESGETTACAADRESDEETSLRFEGRSVAVGYEFDFERLGQRFHEEVFCRKANWLSRARFKLDPHEHTEAEWVTSQEALERLKFDSNREGLRFTLTRIQSN